jgi:putative glutathione S-transferase
MRRLKGLEGVISMSVLDPIRDANGWAFRDVEGADPDPLNGFSFLSEAYAATDPDYAGRATVPVLWDRNTERVINNESAEILRMLNFEFEAFATSSVDFYPQPLRDEIDALNERIYETVNNGVYRAGFARTQTAYAQACDALFETFDWLEDLLARRRYLAGSQITEADWRLFTTLVRFDAVYYIHFKCSKRRLVDYPNLWGYTRELYQVGGVQETVDFDHIKRHYYLTHPGINPTGIVPCGPEIDFTSPHGRDEV